MPLSYTAPEAPVPRPAPVDPLDLSGEDVSLRGGAKTITPAGDWSTLRGVPAARQSVEREAEPSPGAFVRRPTWGWGLRAEIAKPLSGEQIDRIKMAADRGLQNNPRVTRIVSIDAARLSDGRPGLTLDVRVEAGGRDARMPILLVPRGA